MGIKPNILVLPSPLCSTLGTGTCWTVFLLFSGGVLHCYFSLFNVGRAAGPWTYSSWSKEWDHILPLPWSNTAHRPTGTELLSFAICWLKILAICDVEFRFFEFENNIWCFRCGWMQVVRYFTPMEFVQEYSLLWEATTNMTITATGTFRSSNITIATSAVYCQLHLH